MSEEFESLNSKIPDLETALIQRVADRKGTSIKPTGFDPYQAMLKKKEGETAPVDPATIRQWPEKDVKALEEYCQKMGIVGFNCGRMPPIVALAMLKQQCGDYTDVPLEERVPPGYEKIGTPPNYGPKTPYLDTIKNKQLLFG